MKRNGTSDSTKNLVVRYLAALTDDEYDQLAHEARNTENHSQPTEPDNAYPAAWGFNPRGDKK